MIKGFRFETMIANGYGRYMTLYTIFPFFKKPYTICKLWSRDQITFTKDDVKSIPKPLTNKISIRDKYINIRIGNP